MKRASEKEGKLASYGFLAGVDVGWKPKWPPRQKHPMKTIAICAVYALATLAALADVTPTLEKARQRCQEADALLNKTYKSTCDELSKEQALKLRELQRAWWQSRDEKAESSLSFNGIHTDKPKESVEYWQYKASLTEERREFLRVYSGRAIARGISGEYSDFSGGNLRLKETKKGITFSLTAVRGPAAHTGEISGTATRHGDGAIYTEIVAPEEGRKACEITFTFVDGHIAKVTGKNTDYYGGAGVIFDGTYFKTR